jgi:hypothetical protein
MRVEAPDEGKGDKMKRNSLVLAALLGACVLMTVAVLPSYALSEADKEDLLKRINGARYSYDQHGMSQDERGRGPFPMIWVHKLDVRGDTIKHFVITPGGSIRDDGITFKIDGQTIHYFQNGRPNPNLDGVITWDGNAINAGGMYFKREQ